MRLSISHVCLLIEGKRIGFGIEGGGGGREKKQPQVIRKYYRDKCVPLDQKLFHTRVFLAIGKASSSEVPSVKS